MQNNEKRFCLETWGDYACFTRPEMKVERVSYDVITPSAARAIFEAIFWKPAIRWHIREIEVLTPIKTISVRRNEVGATAGTGKKKEIFIEDHRQQRSGIILRDVRYRIHAWMEYVPVSQRKQSARIVSKTLVDVEERLQHQESLDAWHASKDETPGKYLAMFERRARKGQCFNQPYFGCREFAANFELIDDSSKYADSFRPIDETRDLGFMLYDMDFSNPQNIVPAFFRATITNGKIVVPPWDSEEVRR